MKLRRVLWEVVAPLLKGAMAAAILLSLALPAAAQDKVWRVGLLSGGSEDPEGGLLTTWRSGVLLSLDRNGFRLGRNLELVSR